jgi:hypothetical protein
MAFVLWAGLTKSLDHTGEPKAMTPTPMTASGTASAPRTRLRRFAPVGLVVVGVVMLVALAAWLLAPSHSSPTVGWSLASATGGPAFRPDTAQEATIVLVTTSWWPGCSPWGDLGKSKSDSSWLTPDITYTPWAVTITLHESESYVAARCHPFSFYDYWGLPVEVHLSGPLGGRALFDGSKFPPAARPYP